MQQCSYFLPLPQGHGLFLTRPRAMREVYLAFCPCKLVGHVAGETRRSRPATAPAVLQLPNLTSESPTPYKQTAPGSFLASKGRLSAR